MDGWKEGKLTDKAARQPDSSNRNGKLKRATGSGQGQRVGKPEKQPYQKLLLSCCACLDAWLGAHTPLLYLLTGPGARQEVDFNAVLCPVTLPLPLRT